MVWGLGIRVRGLGFMVLAQRFGVQCLGFRVSGLGFRLWVDTQFDTLRNSYSISRARGRKGTLENVVCIMKPLTGDCLNSTTPRPCKRVV